MKKKNAQKLIPNYTVEEAIRMLPLIKSYCKDLQFIEKRAKRYAELSQRIVSLIAIGPNREKKKARILDYIVYKMARMQERILEWDEELSSMMIGICNFKMGAVDVPVYVEDIDNVVFLCIRPDSIVENLQWHSIDDKCDDARPFKWIPS